MYTANEITANRLKNLEAHLEQENSVLLHAVQSFRTLDQIAYGMGILNNDESYATRIPWWPLVAILGTFSAGKSTFINALAGQEVSRSSDRRPTTDRVIVYRHVKTEISGDVPTVDFAQPEVLHDNRALEKVVLLDFPDFDSAEESLVFADLIYNDAFALFGHPASHTLPRFEP